MQLNHYTTSAAGICSEMVHQVIDMHQMGYELDFYETPCGLFCPQNGMCFPWNQLVMGRLCLPGDLLGAGGVQLYWVETTAGFRGLLLSRQKAYLARTTETGNVPGALP